MRLLAPKPVMRGAPNRRVFSVAFSQMSDGDRSGRSRLVLQSNISFGRGRMRNYPTFDTADRPPRRKRKRGRALHSPIYVAVALWSPARGAQRNQNK